MAYQPKTLSKPCPPATQDIALNLKNAVHHSAGSHRSPILQNNPQISQIQQMSRTHKNICGNLSHLRMTARSLRLIAKD